MSMRSAVVVSAREDVSAEAVTKAVTSDAEAADAGITAGTMRNIVNVADSAVVTAPVAKTAAMGRTAGSAAATENAAVAIKRQQNASSQVTAKNGNVRSVKRRKNPVSATASPRERDNENSYIFAAKAAVVLLRQIVYS